MRLDRIRMFCLYDYGLLLIGIAWVGLWLSGDFFGISQLLV